MTCGQLPLGGCDLADLTHTGPCVVDGRLTRTAARKYGERADEVLARQLADWSEPMVAFPETRVAP